MGIGMLVFWPALFALEGGDGPGATEYARLKGEYEAVRSTSVLKECGLRFQDDLADVVADKPKEQTGEGERPAGPPSSPGDKN